MKRQFILKLAKAFIYVAFEHFHIYLNVPKATTKNGHLYSFTSPYVQLKAWIRKGRSHG
jgi:hypothetical protein